MQHLSNKLYPTQIFGKRKQTTLRIINPLSHTTNQKPSTYQHAHPHPWKSALKPRRSIHIHRSIHGRLERNPRPESKLAAPRPLPQRPNHDHRPPHRRPGTVLSALPPPRCSLLLISIQISIYVDICRPSNLASKFCAHASALVLPPCIERNPVPRRCMDGPRVRRGPAATIRVSRFPHGVVGWVVDGAGADIKDRRASGVKSRSNRHGERITAAQKIRKIFVLYSQFCTCVQTYIHTDVSRKKGKGILIFISSFFLSCFVHEELEVSE